MCFSVVDGGIGTRGCDADPGDVAGGVSGSAAGADPGDGNGIGE